jgi:hypothetical protein
MGICFEPLHGQQRGQRTGRPSFFYVVFRKALDFSKVNYKVGFNLLDF